MALVWARVWQLPLTGGVLGLGTNLYGPFPRKACSPPRGPAERVSLPSAREPVPI